MMSKRVPGEATQIFLYRYLTRTRRGQPRELVDNFTVRSDLERVVRDIGPGRYRLEWRDNNRWIVRVRVWVVRENGEVVVGKPRRPRRKVGPPIQVGRPPREERRTGRDSR